MWDAKGQVLGVRTLRVYSGLEGNPHGGVLALCIFCCVH